MMFRTTTEQEELRAVVRSFLAAASPEEETRRLMESTTGYDPVVWRRFADELGLAGLAIPERLGGAGASAVEVAIVMEEMGRAMVCSPFFATSVLAVTALMHLDDESVEPHLKRITQGDLLATGATVDAPDVGATIAEQRDGRWWISGDKVFVVDGVAAELILVAAQTPAGGTSIFEVWSDAPGLTRTPMQTLDLTRKQARLQLADVPARLLGQEGAGEVILDVVHDRAVTALAAEQVGGAQRCLDMAVEYAKQREQFGRLIGSFQAIKHRCADVLVAIEGARSAARYAAWAVAHSPEELPVAAAVAAMTCSDAYVFASSENVQIHGGIGFTWEHPAHLFVRRARSAQVMFGGPAEQRTRLAARLGIHRDGVR